MKSVRPPLLTLTDAGLFCATGNFYTDPWQPVSRALITHAHSDHAHLGSERYLATVESLPLLRARLGDEANIETLAYGETVMLDSVRVSFHPAGHVLGSAQIRLEAKGDVWVVSGDYKLAPDATCARFEPVKCRVFSESTFGLPVYRWEAPDALMQEINEWWRGNRETGRASLLYAYSLGKAQRILSGVDAGAGPIYAHGAVAKMNDAYRRAGVHVPKTLAVTNEKRDWSDALIIAPPSAMNTPWTRRFGDASRAFASGWMTIRGMKRRRNVDRGFALSDHADWPSLLRVIAAVDPEQVWLTHGYAAELARFLVERGIDAREIETRFTGEKLEELEQDDA